MGIPWVPPGVGARLVSDADSIMFHQEIKKADRDTCRRLPECSYATCSYRVSGAGLTLRASLGTPQDLSHGGTPGVPRGFPRQKYSLGIPWGYPIGVP